MNERMSELDRNFHFACMRQSAADCTMEHIIAMEQECDRARASELALLARVAELEARLAEEIKWGHRNCTGDNCRSSGTDCPANTENPHAAS